jgi:hypothetical protein
MEASLLLLVTVLLYRSVEWSSQKDFRALGPNVVLGVCIALSLLTRLDMIIGIAPLVWYLSLRFIIPRHRNSWKRFVPVLGIPFFAGSAYLAYNLANTNHFMPVSAKVKQVFFIPFEVSWNVLTSNGRPFPFLVAIFPMVISLTCFPVGYFIARRKVQQMPWTILMLNAGVMAYYIYLRLFASNFFYWYLSFPLAVAAISLVYLLDSGWGLIANWCEIRVSRILRILAVVVGISTSIFFFGVMNSYRQTVSFHLMRIANELDAKLSQDAVVGTFDAGVIGYFSNHRVVNLDGLANSYDYLRNYRIPHRFLEYFDKQGITHFLVRDSLLSNHIEVEDDNYEYAHFIGDANVILHKTDEVLRYRIPKHFAVFCYRIAARTPNNAMHATSARFRQFPRIGLSHIVLRVR